MNDLNTVRICIRIVLQYVIANKFRNGNHPLAADHDPAVAINCIRSVYGSDKMWPMLCIHGSPGQVTDPGRQS